MFHGKAKRMWIKCTTILDEPDKVGPFELIDVLLLLAVFMVITFFSDVFFGLTVTVALLAALYYLKRGKPPGALQHWLHAMEFVKLPGFLSPRRKRYGPY